jgi:RepB DNA-primase N-terminal domain
VTTLYRMHDAPDAPKSAIACTVEEARYWNTPERGHGIFATVNTFAGARRKANLTRINAWPIDIDAGTKPEQAKRLMKAPLVPSLIVETKRGYQAYWCAKDGHAEHWNALVLERLVPHFGADKNARDLCRILRVAGFLHLKDPTSPFKIRTVWKHEVAYTERQLGEAFAWVPNEQERRHAHEEAKREHDRARGEIGQPGATEDFWQAVYNLDCEEGLRRLSGSGWVNGEHFTFRHCTNGNRNILVDGKGTSCFVDAAGRIGSLDGGGPTMFQWLRWYRVPAKECVEALKSIFPHLKDIDEAQRRNRRAA